MNRRHEPCLDSEVVQQQLRHRADGVGRAGRVADDVVPLLVVLLVVDAEHECDVGLGRGRGDQDFRGAGIEVLGGSFAVGKQPGRFDDDVDAEIAPRQRLRVTLGEHLEGTAVDADLVA